MYSIGAYRVISEFFASFYFFHELDVRFEKVLTKFKVLKISVALDEIFVDPLGTRAIAFVRTFVVEETFIDGRDSVPCCIGTRR